MLKFIAILTAIFLMSISAEAQQSQTFRIGGEGLSSCGAWTRARQEKSFDATLYREWVAGFLSGVIIYSRDNVLAGSDFDGVWGWVDNYCHSHPLDHIADAAFALVTELQSQPHGDAKPRK